MKFNTNINYYPLVNRIVSTLRIKDSLSKQPKEEHFFSKPFITIAREPGSGGAPIARALAEKLNFRVRDKSIVDAVAKSAKQRRAIIRQIDEKGRTYVDDIIHSVLNPEYVDENIFIRELTRVILLFAHEGNCVILGRGGNFITPFARGLHVNIVAPYEVRVQRAMKYEGFSERKARAVISKTEKERKEFVQAYLKKNVDRHSAYDLTLNTASYTVDEAADIIMMAFRRKFPAFKRLKSALF